MYNKEENVAHTVEQIKGALQGQLESYEIVLVNDGSTDGTLEAAKRLVAADERVRVVSYARNGGRGKALRTGFTQSRGEIVASIDADLSYSPEIILAFVRTLQDDPELDMVLASPYMNGGSVQGLPPMRSLVSRLGNMVLSAAIPGHVPVRRTHPGVFRLTCLSRDVEILLCGQGCGHAIRRGHHTLALSDRKGIV